MIQVRRRIFPGAESNGSAITETTLQFANKEDGSRGMDSRKNVGGDGNSARRKLFGGISYKIKKIYKLVVCKQVY